MPIFLSPSLVHLSTHLLTLLLVLGGAAVCHFPQMAVKCFLPTGCCPSVMLRALGSSNKAVSSGCEKDITDISPAQFLHPCCDRNPQGERVDKHTDTGGAQHSMTL